MKLRNALQVAGLAAAVLGFSAPAYAIMQRDYSQDIVRHQDEMRACMGEHRGTVTLDVVVRGDGHLERAEVRDASSNGMREGGLCVARAARGWTFQQSTSGAHVSYRLTSTDRAVQVRRAQRRSPAR